MRGVIAASVAAVALIVSGCTSAEDDFVERMQGDRAPAMPHLGTDDEIVELGEAACDMMDVATPEQFVASGIDQMGYEGVDWEGMGFVVSAAGSTLCPEHEGWMD